MMRGAIALWALLLGCSIAAQTTRTVWDGVYTPEQAARGKLDYMESCASCHGQDLGGGSGGSDGSPGLKKEDFGVGWRDLGRLTEFLRTQMPGNAPGSLPRVVTVDILAYLLQQNGYPSGDAELKADVAALSRTLVVKKP